MATKDQLVARAMATEADRNEVFLESQELREETFREWLANKDITVPDDNTMTVVNAKLNVHESEIDELQAHNHDNQYANIVNEHTHSNKETLDEITPARAELWDNKSDFSGNYNDLTNKPTIPSKVSELQNDSNFTPVGHKHDDLYAKASSEHTHDNKGVLDTITINRTESWDSKSEFSGKYEDLQNKPVIPSVEGLASEQYVRTLVSSAVDSSRVNISTFGIEEGEYADPELNTLKLQEAINFCKNDKVLVFPAGTFIFNSIDLGEKNNITIEGVSSSFASFAQKNIKTGEITDTFTKIICNSTTNGTFFNHKNCVLVMKNIAFYNVKKDNDGMFTSQEAKEYVFMKHTRTDGEGKNTEKGKVFLTDCAFFGWKVCFGDEITLQVLEDELQTHLKESDYEYVKQCCVVAHRCRFTRNGVAINQPVDARMIDCSFNKNDYAIMCREDSGFSTFSNCRIEWNIKNGIYCDKCHDVTITECEFDCNGWAGLYIINNKHCNFSNNIFRRNGAYVETQEDESHKQNYTQNVHIYADNNKDCIIMGTNTVKKQNNDLGTGTDRPSNCTSFTNNTRCILSYNVLNGCTRNGADANKMENNTDCIIGNNIL